MNYNDLPETPTRPHTYFALESVDVSVKHPEREAPIRIHCKVAGRGRPLLLIHGLMTSSYSFRYVIPALAQKYRVIVPDLIGAGRSESPTDLSMSPPSMANLISALISALEIEPPYLVGNSLGGYYALWFSVLFPHQVHRLIVMHAPGFPQLRISLLHSLLAFPLSRMALRWMMCQDPEGFVARNIHYHDASLLSREEAREYGAIFRDRDRTEAFLRILSESLDPRFMRELAEQLVARRDDQRALIPIRLFWAREDVMVPPNFGLRYQKLLPDAELIWFNEASHFLQVDDPDRTIQELMKFDP